MEESHSSESGNQGWKIGKRILLIVSIFVIVLMVVLFSMLWSPEGGLFEDNLDEKSWYFRGAFSDYEGQTSYLLTAYDVSMRLEIVDLNSSHLKLLANIDVTSNWVGRVYSQQNTTWVPKEDVWGLTWEEIDKYSVLKTEDQVYIEGLGTRYCEIYEASMIESEEGNMTITIFYDSEMAWPIKFSLDMSSGNRNINFDINLKDTNIPELT